MRVAVIAVLALGVLAGCGQSQRDGVLTVTLNPGDFEHKIDARGQLEPANAVSVSVPSSLRGPQSLSWVADNFTPVKQGQVVARLDASRQQLDARMAQFEIDKLVIDGVLQRGKDGNLLDEIHTGQTVTRQERELAERFFSDDPRVYSRIEVIDNMRNKGYLDAKLGYLDWDLGEQSHRSDAEQQLIELKQRGHKAKVDRAQGNLQKMEVVAPADGLFVLSSGFRGQPVVSGDTVWSGMTIGQIPDLSVMEARLYVLESEAAGLAVGQPVTLYLDAYPQQAIAGTVTQVDTLAKPRQDNSPVNYFGFTVTLAYTDTGVMFPGRELTGQVEVDRQQGVISVPNQSLYQKDGRRWVYLKQGDQFVERTIMAGARSLNRTVILDGLSDGDTIALVKPGEIRR
ncbi:Multidrug efflux pump subunit AcrA (membrane-fusion protein) [Ferrimonas sediminum]|uniref:Multidrug efflux pump subunit AcrA (Membrane-fusion protein) n=1 Tax=Ferrimonas sediminum TaxID=718193 RepID=A0A1G8TSJ8_9GAMM|nr:HlyD family efflux transporter periplasmic adaptor subunit [Ferrimonas sediminum]SDJ44397.1 Multidrug efflux pump subunit AcrA (membrane-fusion protein) [Ferrimonas sediminum]